MCLGSTVKGQDSKPMSNICCFATLCKVVQGGCNAVITGALSRDSQAWSSGQKRRRGQRRLGKHTHLSKSTAYGWQVGVCVESEKNRVRFSCWMKKTLLKSQTYDITCKEVYCILPRPQSCWRASPAEHAQTGTAPKWSSRSPSQGGHSETEDKSVKLNQSTAVINIVTNMFFVYLSVWGGLQETETIPKTFTWQTHLDLLFKNGGSTL